MPSRRAALQALAALGLLPAALRAASGSLIQLFGKPPQSTHKVFVTGPPAAVLVTVLAPERLMGWPSALSDAQRTLLPAAARDKPVLGRLLGRGSTVSLEALLALQPDLVLDAGSISATYVSTAQRVADQTGLPYALVDGRLADTPRQLREVGVLLGVRERGEQLALYADETLSAASAQRGAGATPGVYLARGNDGLETATAGSINAEIIEAAGGRNVVDAGRGGSIARVSMEQVLAWAPDWVLTQDRNFHALARTDTAWQALPAVRAGRVLLTPDRPFGWVDGPPGVNRLIGVRWLAASLQRGATVDFTAEAQRFYALFYGVTPSREELQALLDGRG